MLATLRAMLNYAMKRGYVDQNPVAKVEFSVVRLGEVQIYTPDEVQRILDDCLEHDLGLLPYRVLTLYCGIRPHGEATRLRWSDVSLADKIVKLHGSITKKGRSRYPALSDNAVAWLEAYRPRCPIWEGPVVPYSRYVLESHCKANLRRAGVKGIKNGSRHSYISYHLAMHQDIDGLTIQSGHRSIQTVWAHYYRAATKAEAEKYWSIVPTTVTDKVMAFNA
jgi:integrase